MTISEALERGDLVLVDGDKHPTLANGIRKCEVVKSVDDDGDIEVRPEDSDIGISFIIFKDESDCIIIDCDIHGRKIYHKGEQGWVCPHCEI